MEKKRGLEGSEGCEGHQEARYIFGLLAVVENKSLKYHDFISQRRKFFIDIPYIHVQFQSHVSRYYSLDHNIINSSFSIFLCPSA